jgi:hypothetical protein
MPSIPPDQVSPIGYSIAGAVRATGNSVSRIRMFELIKAGAIDARKIGRRTVVIPDSLQVSMAGTKCAELRRDSVPVELRENGCGALVYCCGLAC